MQFIDIPTEQTTAITDVILALVASSGIFRIYKSGFHFDRYKSLIWLCAFSFLAIAAVLGSIAHGFKMPEEINKIIWHPLNLLLGVTVALFLVGVIYDLKGNKLPRWLFILIIFSGVVFFTITVMFQKLFFVFILYESVAMIIALVSYIILMTKKTLSGASFMALGIFISIIAAIVQSIPALRLSLIWEFDHNGLFHIIQIPGLFFLFSGIGKSFQIKSVS